MAAGDRSRPRGRDIRLDEDPLYYVPTVTGATRPVDAVGLDAHLRGLDDYLNVIIRAIDNDLTVVAGTTRLQRDPTIALGVTVTIELGGELLIL